MTATTCNPEYVILVDKQNRQVGIAEKLQAHQHNLLHRAFSVFLFRRQGPDLEWLLQQRSLHKYHSPGLWTNTCCSHPRPGETIIQAGKRRLQEELGAATALQDLGWFYYNAHFSNGLSEHEIDHVLIGEISLDTVINPDPNEIQAVRWVQANKLEQELAAQPNWFTPWLPQVIAKVKDYLDTLEIAYTKQLPLFSPEQ